MIWFKDTTPEIGLAGESATFDPLKSQVGPSFPKEIFFEIIIYLY